MSLQGTLDTMAVDELLGWLSRTRRSGILTIKRPAVTKTLNVEQGRVLSAASTDPREYFGQFLINFGLLTEDQLQKAFETQQETRVLLGKILVMTGLVTEEQILKILELKIRETVLDTYLWSDGNFEFQDGVLTDDPSKVPVAVELIPLGKEGLARRERFRQIRAAIPDNACTFRYVEKLDQPAMDRRSSAGVMLEMARQGLSAADIILRFHSLDYPILHTLHDLVQRGWLEVIVPAGDAQQDLPVIDVDLSDVQAEERSSGPDRYLLQAQAAMKKREFGSASAILRKGLAEHSYNPDLSNALEMSERGLLEQLRADLLATDRIPRLTREDTALMSENWTPAERYILSRIDGRRHLRSIIMVSPLKEVDALRTFRALLDAGVVALG